DPPPPDPDPRAEPLASTPSPPPRGKRDHRLVDERGLVYFGADVDLEATAIIGAPGYRLRTIRDLGRCFIRGEALIELEPVDE
ncbi:MAG: hypothetical protein KDC38_18735, partial [Planctomycetes bacterium]|nr:hypothetical protein [Planctomycetota bacterium]